jgi:hypothetical protein
LDELAATGASQGIRPHVASQLIREYIYYFVGVSDAFTHAVCWYLLVPSG